MKLFYISLFAFLVSCNSNSKPGANNDPGSINDKDSNTVSANKTKTESTIIPGSPLAEKINTILGSMNESAAWHVLNDKEARWISGQFEYFIAPKRKDHPDYPYIASGDFDGDKRPDLAAVVTDSTRVNYQLVIISDLDSGKKIKYWKEDIMEDAAISTAPKGYIEGTLNEKVKKVKLESEAIHVEYFEKASFIIYWDGKSFKRIQQGD